MVMVTTPVFAPAVVGLKVTVKVAVLLGATVKGVPGALSVKPAPALLVMPALLTVSASVVLVFCIVKVTGPTGVLKFVVPKS